MMTKSAMNDSVAGRTLAGLDQEHQRTSVIPKRERRTQLIAFAISSQRCQPWAADFFANRKSPTK
jgi:hypothetical protein